jgi:hypothetical protein
MMMTNAPEEDHEAQPAPAEPAEGTPEYARREALKRLGLYGASTAPAMMLLFSHGGGNYYASHFSSSRDSGGAESADSSSSIFSSSSGAQRHGAVTTSVNVTTGTTV